MRFAIVFLALASFAVADPILVLGGGSFEYDLTPGGGSDFTISLNGSADGGMRSVSIFATCEGSPQAGCLGPFAPSYADIDGMNFSLGYFSFGFGNGGGSITGFDSQHNPVATEQIAGFISTTSLACVNGNPQTCEGTFAVGAPEPAMGILVAGLGLLFGLVWRRAVRKRSTVGVG